MIKDFFFFQDFAYDDIQTNTLGSLITSTQRDSVSCLEWRLFLMTCFLDIYNILHSKYFNKRHILSWKYYHHIQSTKFYKSYNWESRLVEYTVRCKINCLSLVLDGAQNRHVHCCRHEWTGDGNLELNLLTETGSGIR